MAETLADEVIRSSSDFDSTERAPICTAEARVTLGVIAAREGDTEQAVHQGEQALSSPRQSLPTLAMVSRDLARILKDRYPESESAELVGAEVPHPHVGVVAGPVEDEGELVIVLREFHLGDDAER